MSPKNDNRVLETRYYTLKPFET